MINRALSALTAQLNEFLASRFGTAAENRAVLGPVPDLTRDATSENPIVLSLVRVEEERTFKTQTATQRRDNHVDEVQPDIKLNLFLLLTAQGKFYETSLERLSAAVMFFQSRPVFDHATCPELDSSIEKLLVELYSQTFEEQSQLWGSLSLRYVPSVLYRVRMLAIQEGTPYRTAPAVSSLATSVVKV